MKDDVLWITLYTLIAGAVGSLTTWRASSVMWNRRLHRVERQAQATLILALELALAMGLDSRAIETARRALGPEHEDGE